MDSEYKQSSVRYSGTVGEVCPQSANLRVVGRKMVRMGLLRAVFELLTAYNYLIFDGSFIKIGNCATATN